LARTRAIVVQKTQWCANFFATNVQVATTILTHSLQRQNQETTGESTMARADTIRLPRQNPCAQCGKPIAMPEWVEASEGRTCYLWHCWACDYRFEAIAFEPEVVREPIAA
jgi:hypothetical protein